MGIKNANGQIITTMLQIVNPQDAVAFGRLMEFLSPTPPWNRSLWSIGLVLGLQELCEASRGSAPKPAEFVQSVSAAYS
ncbi:MAG TPA: hypothetical protein PLB25_06460, partial [Rhodoferax sp.]|nr:hypothetical protein [Rhodoferax sp.]